MIIAMERDTVGRITEQLRSRAQELRPAYEEYLELHEALRALEDLGSVANGRRSYAPTVTVEQRIRHALSELGDEGYSAREISHKVEELYGGPSHESIRGKLQEMHTQAKVNRPRRATYRLWPEERS